MLERLIFIGFLAMAGAVFYQWWTKRHLARINRQEVSPQHDPIRSRLRSGQPAIIYFTTPDCIPCQTRQRPALEQLVQQLGPEQIQVIEIDASQEPELAQEWGVMTAPTTFVLNSEGQSQAVNYGVAETHKLIQQLTA